MGGEKSGKRSTDLLCGGIAGCAARTFVAPMDRVKVLLQTAPLRSSPVASGAPHSSPGIIGTFRSILDSEGIQGLWRGNGTNCIRVFPYSAFQFASFETAKSFFLKRRSTAHQEQMTLQLHERFLSGAFAGIIATSLTHPLDVLRITLATSTKSERKTLPATLRQLIHEGGLFRGYNATLVSLVPFVSINFASYDHFKVNVYRVNQYPNRSFEKNLSVLASGVTAALVANSICYPLDLVRRRMQTKAGSTIYRSPIDALRTIVTQEGIIGLYRGIGANTLKLVPNAGIRFMVYELLRDILLDEPTPKPTVQ
eukprot:g3675.t1